jgi:hypothetical protein
VRQLAGSGKNHCFAYVQVSVFFFIGFAGLVDVRGRFNGKSIYSLLKLICRFRKLDGRKKS